MTEPSRPVRSSLVGLLAGTAALAIVTAFLVIFVSSLRAADQTTTLLARLQQANAQIDDLRADQQTSQQTAERLEAQNARLLKVNQRQRAVLNELVRFLRANGLDAPATPQRSAAPPGGGASVPKAPSASSPSSSTPPPAPSPPPGSPAPTATPAPSPSPTDNGLTDLACDLSPVLCPLIRR